MDGYSRLTKIFLLIKMASVRDLHISKLTVKKLTQLAKERDLKGYSKKINLNWYGYWNHKKTL